MLYSSSNSKASHNKDYSVVKTFGSPSTISGGFFILHFSPQKKDDQAMPGRPKQVTTRAFINLDHS